MNETINQRVVKCRKLADLTQADVAEKLGMKGSTYSQMERKGIISAERLSKMAEIFDVSPNYLLTGEEISKYTIPPIVPQGESIPQPVLMQPEPVLPQKKVFVVTKKEENLIKIIRFLSKPNYDKVIKFIDSVYHEEKH